MANLQAAREWGRFFRRVSLWKPGEEDSLIIRGTAERKDTADH